MNIYMSVAILYLLIINKFESAYLFGICFVVTMLISDLIISLLKKHVKYKILLSILVTTLVVTGLEFLLHKFIPLFYKDMYLYLPLMIPTMYDYNDNRTVFQSFKYTLKGTLKYVVLLLSVVLVKEILFTNTITLMDSISNLTGYKAIYHIFNTSYTIPYAFNLLIVGLALGIANKIRGGKHA